MNLLATVCLFLIAVVFAIAIRLGIAWLLAGLFTWLTGVTTLSGVEVLHIAFGVAIISMLFSSGK